MNFLKLIIRSEFTSTIGIKSIVIDFETATLNRLVGDKDLNRVILSAEISTLSGPKWTEMDQNWSEIGPIWVKMGNL